MYTAVLHLHYSSFGWGGWVTVVCKDESRKKRSKATGTGEGLLSDTSRKTL